MKKILVILFMLFIFKINTFALKYGGCEYSDVARLKKLVTNINVTYNYRIVNNTAYFDVTLTNLTTDMYVMDNVNKQKYYNIVNGELTIYNYATNSVTFKIYSNKNECRDILLGSKYATLPIYNSYYKADVCKNVENLVYCNKWVSKSYSYDEIKKAVDEYNEKQENQNKPTPEPVHIKTFWEKLLSLYISYYYIILPVIIALCIVGIQIKKRTSRFKL